MPWPTDDLSTSGVDSGADRRPRAEFFKLFQRVKTIIAGRGTVDGVASLDSRRRVPDAELGRGVAGGVASLDGAGRVPGAQLPSPPAPPQAVPPGTIVAHAGTRPTGWLSCRGAAVSRATYPALFAVLGTRFGAGDGSTTFNLPDLRGRFPYGASVDADVGNTGGAETHTLTVDEMPSHAHILGGVRQDGAGADRNRLTGTTGTASTVAAGDTYGVRHAGGGQPHNNMPPYIEINYIIRV